MSLITRNIRPIKALKVKLKNRRVVGGLMHDGTVLYKFKILDHGSVSIQKIRLTPEAIAVMFQLAIELGALKGGII